MYVNLSLLHIAEPTGSERNVGFSTAKFSGCDIKHGLVHQTRVRGRRPYNPSKTGLEQIDQEGTCARESWDWKISLWSTFVPVRYQTEKNVAYHPMNLDFTYFFTWKGTEDRYDVSDSPCTGRKYEGYFDGNDRGDLWDLHLFNRVFLFSSPRSTNYNVFVKEACLKVYLNPWTKQECKKFAELMDLEDKDEWLRRFNLVGGKPRFIFTSSYTYASLVHLVENIIPHNFNDLKDQVRLFGKDVFYDRMMNIVFNMYRDDNDPTRFYVAYSSLAVEVIMNVRNKCSSADEIRLLLQTPAHSLQSWRGREMEKFMLQDLATATFCIKSLEEPNPGQVDYVGPFKAKSRIIQA